MCVQGKDEIIFFGCLIASGRWQTLEELKSWNSKKARATDT